MDTFVFFQISGRIVRSFSWTNRFLKTHATYNFSINSKHLIYFVGNLHRISGNFETQIETRIQLSSEFELSSGSIEKNFSSLSESFEPSEIC